MRTWDILKSKQKRKSWRRAFHIWQLRPYELAPISDISSVCSSCGMVFQGNFCPRCGQSAEVGRFSFRKAFLLFLDVWGIGNRSMFRSIRDLMLRPGYMIRDYLCGMQSAYFPPFKMFFILMAFSLIVEQGFNLGLDEEVQTEIVQTGVSNASIQAGMGEEVTINNKDIRDNRMYYNGLRFAKILDKLREKNPAIFALFLLMLFSVPFFLFFRSTPAIPDLRYSEFFVALVYTSNTFSIFSILGNLLNSSLIKLLAVVMVFVALKQFSGYSKWRVFRYMALSILMTIIVITLLVGLYILILYLCNS